MTTLAQLLLAKQPLFDLALQQLEARSGRLGVDVRLLADMAERAGDRLRQLGLAPDCTGPQLYAALIERVRQDDWRLGQALGADDPYDPAEVIPLIVRRVSEIDLPRSGHFMKIATAEQMLRQQPPPKMMKRLGYTNVEDMINNEDIFELFLALRFAEDGEWLNRFLQQYQDLKPSDFAQRDVRVVPFDSQKWGDLADHYVTKKRHNITHSKEMGAIAILPVRLPQMRGITLKVLPLLIHYYNEVRLYSAFFKLISGQRGFGAKIVETLVADPDHTSIIKGQRIHWRVIQRYFGRLKDELHPEIFEPHVQPEDLHWRKAEEVLYEIDPELEFWRDMDYVALLKDGEAITFNLMDNALSFANRLGFADRLLYHFRDSLWNEVFMRYMGQKNLEEQVLHNLNNAMIAPEELPV